MVNQKLHITTTRILKLIQYMLDKELASSQGDALAQIGFNPANSKKIKSGENKFTVDQIEAVCRITGASADYVFGYTAIMMRKEPKKAIDVLREAVRVVESELNGK